MHEKAHEKSAEKEERHGQNSLSVDKKKDAKASSQDRDKGRKEPPPGEDDKQKDSKEESSEEDEQAPQVLVLMMSC